MKPVYKRILLKLSGEVLAGEKGSGIDFAKVEEVCESIKECVDLGVEIAIVVGGGNFWRGRSSGKMDRTRADHMGMLATTINSLAMSDALRRKGIPSAVSSAIDMPKIAPLFTKDAAVSAMERGRVVILAGGSGNPFFSTDTAAVLRGAELECDAVLMAKNVDGVYEEDPEKNPNARKIDRMTFAEILQKDLRVIDQAAAALARDNRQLMLIFGMKDPENIVRILEGEERGTVIR